MATQPVAIIRKFGGFVFDATFSEDHDSTTNFTNNPVEDGSVMTDHAQDMPRTLRIQAGVQLISPARFHNSSVQGATVDTSAEGAGDVFTANGQASRPQTAWTYLEGLRTAHEPFDVQTGLKLYTNVMVAHLSNTWTDDLGNLVFTAELREVDIRNTLTTKFAPRKAKPKSDKGQQQGKSLSDKDAITAKQKAGFHKWKNTKTGVEVEQKGGRLPYWGDEWVQEW
jgi:hypothetical protein